MPNISEEALKYIKEVDFQHTVIDFALAKGWLVYHTYDSRRSNPGYPDLSMVRLGRFILAELKRFDEDLTPAQEIWAEALQDCAGIEYYTWWPQDLPEIMEILK